MRPLTLAAGLTLIATGATAQEGVLTVYAPDYFTSEWGPGPAIEEAFEAECGCDLVYAAGDVLPRLMLEGQRTEADVVIGLFNDQMVQARKSGLFAPHGQDNGQLDLPVDWTDDTFLPFDWSYLAFVYDATRIDTPPANFEDLANMPEDVKLVIQDPRSSEAGLALVYWIKAVYGDEAGAYWERLAPHILTVTAGWSEAYGLFTDGEAPIVLSYTTSPAYHIVAEEDETKKAAIFEEGHYPYFELAAKVAGTDVPELADRFMAFVLSDTFQDLIPMGNWSYPSAQPQTDWPEVFRDLPMPDKAVYLGEEEADAMRKAALEEWRQALSR
ncbi:thiamine ABC transporter substrate binding subunit [Pseudooceanicola sp. LIPI14-2-Ac024]|uniref:thiamine ABC transporter substrate-binding protein n=1 Tax=Pseudooceanicola sp. LIPI14-2-Ac024 TaxID=3344875 RepID=UPI0035CF414C